MNEIISLGICDDKNIKISSYNIGKIVSSPEWKLFHWLWICDTHDQIFKVLKLMLSLPKKMKTQLNRNMLPPKAHFFPLVSFSIKFNDENFYYFIIFHCNFFLTFNKNEQKVRFSVWRHMSNFHLTLWMHAGIFTIIDNMDELIWIARKNL